MSGTPDLEAVLGNWSVGAGPLHDKLAGALRRAIESRQLAPGDRLASERDLARKLLVSRGTVVAAYDALRSDGLLESRQGSGTRVARRPSSAVSTAGALPLNPVYRSLLDVNGGDVVSLACAISTTHPRLALAIEEVAREAPATILRTTGYLPKGLPELRAGLADLYTREGLPTTAEQVIVTTGAQQAVNLAAALFVRSGDLVVVESPSFPGTLDALRRSAAGFVAAETDADGVDVDAVRRFVSDSAPALVYLMPSFHNPTGALLSPARRVALAELAAASGVPLVEDNALEQTRLGTDPPPPVAAFGPPRVPVISVGSFSKLVWGGLRVGWMRAPTELITRLGEAKAQADLGSPLFDQAVAAKLLAHIDEMRADRQDHLLASLDRVGRLLGERLPDWRWERPVGGPSLWVQMPYGTAAGFAQVALRHGVEVIPGDAMSPTGGHAAHLRLPFSPPPEILDSVVARLAEAWASYTASASVERPRPSVIV